MPMKAKIAMMQKLSDGVCYGSPFKKKKLTKKSKQRSRSAKQSEAPRSCLGTESDKDSQASQPGGAIQTRALDADEFKKRTEEF